MVQFTRKAIEDTFLEMVQTTPLDKITVKDLVERCGVNRNTFYYHYEDIYDLIEKIFQREKERVLGRDYSNVNYKEALTEVIELLLTHRDGIRNIYNSKGKDIIERYLRELGDDFCGRYVREKARDSALSETALQILSTCYSEALRGVLERWMEQYGGVGQEAFVEVLSRLTEATVLPAIATMERVDGMMP